MLGTLKFSTRKRATGPAIDSPGAFYAYLKDMEDLPTEVFVVLLLTARNRVLGRELVSVGTLTSSLVHPREVFRPAVVAGAAGIVVAHNHPSGDAAPSREDIEVTSRLVAAGDILGIKVLDHLVVGEDSYRSIRELTAM